MIVTTRSSTGMGAEALATRMLLRLGRPLPVGVDLGRKPIPASVNHGRWVISCPFCNGAEFGDPDEPRFFCLSCFNANADGQWLRVVFPPERKEIEAALMERGNVENRNWFPSESVIDLLAQTLEREH